MSEPRRHALAMISPMEAPHECLGVQQCSREDHEPRGVECGNKVEKSHAREAP